MPNIRVIWELKNANEGLEKLFIGQAYVLKLKTWYSHVPDVKPSEIKHIKNVRCLMKFQKSLGRSWEWTYLNLKRKIISLWLIAAQDIWKYICFRILYINQ